VSDTGKSEEVGAEPYELATSDSGKPEKKYFGVQALCVPGTCVPDRHPTRVPVSGPRSQHGNIEISSSKDTTVGGPSAKRAGRGRNGSSARRLPPRRVRAGRPVIVPTVELGVLAGTVTMVSVRRFEERGADAR
jgi:hypothetical protein